MTISWWYTGAEHVIRPAPSIKATPTPGSCALDQGVNVDSSGCVSSSSDRACLQNETRGIRARRISFAAMRYTLLGGIAIIAAFACEPRSAADMSAAEKAAIADSLKQ